MPYWQTLRDEADELEGIVRFEDTSQRIRRTSIVAKRAEADRLEQAHADSVRRQRIREIREIRSQDVRFQVTMGPDGPNAWFHMLWDADRHGWVHAHTLGVNTLSTYGDHRAREWKGVLRWLAGDQNPDQRLVPGTFERWEGLA